MLIRNLPDDGLDHGNTLQAFAKACDVRLELERVATKAGRMTNRFHCVLRYDMIRDPQERTRRMSPSGRRTVGVTWSTQRDFLALLFSTFPDAVVVSSLATYRGADHFRATYPETYSKRSGPMCAPVAFGSL